MDGIPMALALMLFVGICLPTASAYTVSYTNQTAFIMQGANNIANVTILNKMRDNGTGWLIEDCDPYTCDLLVTFRSRVSFSATTAGDFQGKSAVGPGTFDNAQVATMANETVPKYYSNCTTTPTYVANNSTWMNVTKCTDVQNGTYQRSYTVWKPVNGFTFTANTPYTAKLSYTRKTMNATDLVPSIMGTDLTGFAWWNTTWNYKRQINITNWLCKFAYCQFPLNVSLNSTNGSDMRILDSAEASLIPFYRESGNWSSATATGNVWINATNNTATVWIYYNATGTVSDASNGNGVFTFFDDFDNGSSLTAGKWDGIEGLATVGAGIMNYTADNAAWHIIYSTTMMTQNQSMVGRIWYGAFTYVGGGIVGMSDTNNDNGTYIHAYAAGTLPWFGIGTDYAGRVQFTSSLANKWTGVRITWNPVNATVWLDYNTFNGTAIATPVARQVGLVAYGAGSQMRAEWMGMANMGDIIPTFVFGSEQGTPPLLLAIPVYVKTAIASYNGTNINYSFTGIVINNGTNMTDANVSIIANGTMLTSASVNITAGAFYTISGYWAVARPTTDANFTVSVNVTAALWNNSTDTAVMILPIDPPSAINLMANGGKTRCRNPGNLSSWPAGRAWNINASWGCNYTGLNLTNNISYVDSGTTTFSASNITGTWGRLAGDAGAMATFIIQSVSSIIHLGGTI